MTADQSCDVAILVLMIGWVTMIIPSIILTFVLIEVRRDQLLHYAVMREWFRLADRPPPVSKGGGI